MIENALESEAGKKFLSGGILGKIFKGKQKDSKAMLKAAKEKYGELRSKRAAKLLAERAKFFENNKVASGGKMSKEVAEKYKQTFKNTGTFGGNLSGGGKGAIDKSDYQALVKGGFLPKNKEVVDLNMDKLRKTYSPGWRNKVSGVFRNRNDWSGFGF